MRRYVISVVVLFAAGSNGFAQPSPNTTPSNTPATQSPAASPQVPASPPPMRFEWIREGTADKCAGTCREWISASGQIQPDTPRLFVEFMKTRSVAGATVVLDSSGGSVGGAIVLGRLFRQADVITTVGRTQKLADSDSKERIILSPQGLCASMCAFTLLGGKRRHVPVGARVLVHQIWPRVNANDPMAGNYTAKDLVGLQRESQCSRTYDRYGRRHKTHSKSRCAFRLGKI